MSMDRIEFLSDCVLVDLSGADPEHFVDGGDPYFAVADFAASGGVGNRLHDPVRVVLVGEYFDADFRDELFDVFGTSVDLAVALLAAVAAHFGDRHPGDAGVGERRAHGVELEGLDDRGDELHETPPRESSLPARGGEGRRQWLGTRSGQPPGAVGSGVGAAAPFPLPLPLMSF